MSINPYEHTDSQGSGANPEIANTAKQTKVIGIALLVGCVFFLCLAMFISGMSKEIYKGAGIITWLALGLGVVMFVMSMVVPALVVKGQVGRGANHTVTALCGMFRTKIVIGMAMSEGAAFFNIVAYIIDGQLLNIGMALLLFLQIAIRIPTSHTVENFVSEQQQVMGL